MTLKIATQAFHKIWVLPFLPTRTLPKVALAKIEAQLSSTYVVGYQPHIQMVSKCLTTREPTGAYKLTLPMILFFSLSTAALVCINTQGTANYCSITFLLSATFFHTFA